MWNPCASELTWVLVLFLGLLDISNSLRGDCYTTQSSCSNIKYCTLIWMFCRKDTNNKINKIHKCALRVLFKDYDAPFADLLVRRNENTVHVQNLQRLKIEIYKTLQNLSPPFLFECFQRNEIRYNLRTNDTVLLPSTFTVTFGLNSIILRGSILWNCMPAVIQCC